MFPFFSKIKEIFRLTILLFEVFIQEQLIIYSIIKSKYEQIPKA